MLASLAAYVRRYKPGLNDLTLQAGIYRYNEKLISQNGVDNDYNQLKGVFNASCK